MALSFWVLYLAEDLQRGLGLNSLLVVKTQWATFKTKASPGGASANRKTSE